MDVTKPVSTAVAVAQWEQLRDLYTELGHKVSLLNPVDGLPDMVFTANGATVLDGRVLLARFRHKQRTAETASYQDWFRTHGYRDISQSSMINEGEGDFLLVGRRILAGTGFRTDLFSHSEAERLLGLPVTSLTLVDPYYYHLDTALAVLSDDQVAYYPGAFSADSQAVLREVFPNALIATDADAEILGLNAVSDGRHVVLPKAATHLHTELRRRGFEPIGVDVSELLKAGGGVKCCTLELHTAQEDHATSRQVLSYGSAVALPL
jgi:N-dimethylarginine dimethylaminohydrolase